LARTAQAQDSTEAANPGAQVVVVSAFRASLMKAGQDRPLPERLRLEFQKPRELPEQTSGKRHE
jgi:hypothetical protein